MDSETRENQFAALSLGRTAAFMICTIPTLFVSLLLADGTPLGHALPFTENQNFCVIFFPLETILVWLISTGKLPGTTPERLDPIPETTLGVLFTVASAITWALAGTSEASRLIQLVFTWSLLVSVAVYFIAKSAISGRPRWKVLLVAILPALQAGGVIA